MGALAMGSATGVAIASGITRRSPTRSDVGLPRLLAAMISTSVRPNILAILDSESPSCTTYVMGSGVGVAVEVGVAEGVAEGVGEGST